MLDAAPMNAGPPRRPPPPLPPQARVRPPVTLGETPKPPAAPGATSLPGSLPGSERRSEAPSERRSEAPTALPPGATVARGEAMSQAIKDQICEMALGLLEEQVQARIVHYRADLQTNPELDAITAEVVASLKEIQAHATHVNTGRDALRDAHVKLLRGLLERIFRPAAPSLLIEKRMREIHRKLARLFFQSELHEKTSGNDSHTKVIQHGEQAVFYLLLRYKNRLETELDGFDYGEAEIKERAFELLARFGKEMQDGFLGRRSSELKRIVKVFQGVLVDFFCKHISPAAAAIAEEVIVQSASFEGRAFAYKITAEAFPRFRAAFERRMMVRLIGFAEDQLLSHLADTAGAEREETVRFVTDPRVFSMIVGEVSEGVYEFLCNEGFLDLPVDWRAVSGAPAP